MQWNHIDTVPEDRVVMTKIDDEHGPRNETTLVKSGRMWFAPDRSMYIYYAPTHWREMTDDERYAEIARAECKFESVRQAHYHLLADLTAGGVEMITDRQVEAAQSSYRAHVASHGVPGSTEALRSAIEAAEMAAWEPIETAPKDGTEVIVADAFGPAVAAFDGIKPLEEFLLFCSEDETADDYPAYVAEREQEAQGWMRHTALAGDAEFISSPTHWRHLPSAPNFGLVLRDDDHV